MGGFVLNHIEMNYASMQVFPFIPVLKYKRSIDMDCVPAWQNSTWLNEPGSESETIYAFG